MPYFTSRFFSHDGRLLAETDFGQRELVPMVRHLTRRLGALPDIGSQLEGYRAVIVPQSAGRPRRGTYFVHPADNSKGLGNVVQLLEHEVEALTATYDEELDAFYRPGSSRLCSLCPERSRCPGSGLVGAFDPGDWLVFGHTASREPKPVLYLTVTIDTATSQPLCEHDFPLSNLREYLNIVARLLQAEGRMPVVPGNRIYSEILYFCEGEPRFDPAISPAKLERAWRSSPADLPPSTPKPTYRLVDWDKLESASPLETPGAMLDIPIRVLESNSQPLPISSPPASGRVERVGLAGKIGEPAIYIHRKAWNQLLAIGTYIQVEAGGLLVGEPFMSPGDMVLSIEIVASVPALDERGEQCGLSLDHQTLRKVQEQVERNHPGHRAVGWYGYHLLGEQRVTLRATDRDYIAGLGARLFLSGEERFLHQSFFPEAWQVGLIIDAIAGGLQFYFHDKQEVASTAGFYLVD